MQTLARYSVEEIMPLIGFGMPHVKFIVELDQFYVNVASVRMECFKRNPICVDCGIVGSVFMLQRHVYNPPKVGMNCFIKDCPWCALNNFNRRKKHTNMRENPHLNLYGRMRNGRLILMTRDHIFPRSKGGGEDIENMQTMCSTCNNRKADIIPKGWKANVLQAG